MDKIEIKKFFDLAQHNEYDIIEILRTKKEYRNIKNQDGISVFSYLILHNRCEVIKEILDDKLSGYKLFKEAMKSNILNSGYTNDNGYDILNLLKEKDKKAMVFNCLPNIIKFNNHKTLDIVGVESLAGRIKDDTNINIMFHIFARCDDKMLEKAMPIYKDFSFSYSNIINGFKDLANDKSRSIVLIENLNMPITPSLYEDLLRVNDHCTTYLDNRNLKRALEQDLVSENNPPKRNMKI